MSDATLPPLRASSSAAESQSSDASDSKQNEQDVFPFLVHSQDSVTNGDPPEVDNGKLARQKRRRTSPEDQATLEAEYKRNPKPDKAARMEIVSKVSLGEKEVQIWFQNRRQNTRRKSRPLLPHEIAAFGLNGMAAFSSDPASASFFGSSQDTNYNPSCSQLEITSSSQGAASLLKEDDITQHHIPGVSHLSDFVKDTRPASDSIPVTPSGGSQVSLEITTSEIASVSQSHSQAQFMPSTLGYLSNRWNQPTGPDSTPTHAQAPIFATPLNPIILQPSSCPERLITGDRSTPSNSQVRLSMSLDGKAELIASDVSPPRPQLLRPTSSGPGPTRQRRGGLQRSQSALPFGPLPHKTSPTAPFVPRMPSGRSRDARTWEFCCDTEARDELTTQAENESSGSAVAAISLIRSTSSSTLKPNMNKRNAPTTKYDTPKYVKKPKLARSSSSFAKLQGNGKLDIKSPSGDSDKENWIPNDGNGNTRRRPLPTARPEKQARRRILEESSTTSDQVTTNRKHRTQKKSTNHDADIFEDPANVRTVDPEVEKFMKGEVSPSKKGDLDCIQGLLSLSQGNWR